MITLNKCGTFMLACAYLLACLCVMDGWSQEGQTQRMNEIQSMWIYDPNEYVWWWCIDIPFLWSQREMRMLGVFVRPDECNERWVCDQKIFPRPNHSCKPFQGTQVDNIYIFTFVDLYSHLNTGRYQERLR